MNKCLNTWRHTFKWSFVKQWSWERILKVSLLDGSSLSSSSLNISSSCVISSWEMISHLSKPCSLLPRIIYCLKCLFFINFIYSLTSMKIPRWIICSCYLSFHVIHIETYVWLLTQEFMASLDDSVSRKTSWAQFISCFIVYDIIWEYLSLRWLDSLALKSRQMRCISSLQLSEEATWILSESLALITLLFLIL
jgi:hypothetical protein